MNSAAEETFFFFLFASRAEGAAEVEQNIGFVRLQLYLMRFKHDVIHFSGISPHPPGDFEGRSKSQPLCNVPSLCSARKTSPLQLFSKIHEMIGRIWLCSNDIGAL